MNNKVKPAMPETVFDNSLAGVPFKFDFDSQNNSHTIIFAPPRAGMSAGYAALSLSAAEIAKLRSTETRD